MKCAHDTCTCLVDQQGAYCSEACGTMAEGSGAICPCRHAECRASLEGGSGL